MTGSSDDMVFTGSGFHYDSVVLNISGYQTLAANFTVNVGHKIGKKNITGELFHKIAIPTCTMSIDGLQLGMN